MALQKIHLYHYNNYYNRTWKRFKTIAEYAPFEIQTISPISNFNFKPGDSIHTDLIINGFEIPVNSYPDYCIVEYADGTFARWFVMDTIRKMGLQYQLILKRDTLVDYWNAAKYANGFLERGNVGLDDYYVFNKDISTPSMILKERVKVYDKTKTAWAYLFYNSNAFEYVNPTSIEQFKSFPTDYVAITCRLDGIRYDIVFPSQTRRSTNDIFNVMVGCADNHRLVWNRSNPFKIKYSVMEYENQTNDGDDAGKAKNTVAKEREFTFPANYQHDISGDTTKKLLAMLSGSDIPSWVKPMQIYDEQILPFYDNNTRSRAASDYYPNCIYPAIDEDKGTIPIINFNPIINDSTYHMSGISDVIIISNADNPNNAQIEGWFKILSDNTISYDVDMRDIPIKNRDILYGTFPKSSTTLYKDVLMYVKENMNLYETRLVASDYSSVVSFHSAAVGTAMDNDNVYVGMTKLKVRAVLKPSATTFTILPDFTHTEFTNLIPAPPSLYGGNYDYDPRGLNMSSTSFTLPQTSSEWGNYQKTNLNYQNTFNRQIKDMEINNRVERANEVINMASNSLGMTLGGASAGAMVGGPIGAMVGAAVGGIAGIGNAIAGGMQIDLNDQLRQREIDTAKVQFENTKQNIQAVPYTIMSNGADSTYNALYPVIELYQADLGLDKYDQLISLNGESVQRAGTIWENFTIDNPFDDKKTYVLIHLANIDTTRLNINYGIASDIASEAARGIYYTRSDI